MELLARDLQSALDNPEVQSILLDIDSPGGVAVGPSEMADIIRTEQEIEMAFDELQERLGTQKEQKLRDAEQLVLENLNHSRKIACYKRKS